MDSSSFVGTSKRVKAFSSNNNTQVAHCLVDGCNADLSLCRDYHRRHKVCETHSKTPKVTIGGREQRFCQQCSRFHSLAEFDEGKRSCRKRLDGHNRRRRKPQLVSLSRNSPPIFSTQGTRLVSFSTTPPQILPSSSSWGVKLDNNEINLYNNHQQQQQQQQQMNNYIERQNSFNNQNDVFTPGLNQDVSNSNRVHSLLSTSPLLPQITREFGLNQNLNYSNTGLASQYRFGQEIKPVFSATASTLHFPDMSQQGTEGSSTSGPHQTLTFIWE